jgi:predicted nucleic acid-binding protein
VFRYVVPDSCSLGAAFFKETYSSNAAPMLAAIRLGTVDAIAQMICIGEFLNLCRKKLGEGVAASDVDAVISDFLSLPIVWFDIEPFFARRSWQLFRTSSIGTNDAFFIQLAQRMGAELWTIDGGLAANGPSVYSGVVDLRAIAFK